MDKNQNRGQNSSTDTTDESVGQEVQQGAESQMEQTDTNAGSENTQVAETAFEAASETNGVEESTSDQVAESAEVVTQEAASAENHQRPEVDAAGNPITTDNPAVVVQQSGDQEITQQQADVKVEETHVAAAAPQEVPAVQQAAALESAFGHLKQLSPVAKVIADAIDAYIREMMPGRPMSVQTGVMHQSRLYRALILTINNLTGEEFHDVFSAILQAFTTHAGERGVFGEKFVFRFPENLNGDPEQQQTFYSLLTLFIALGPVASRQASLKQINVMRCLKGGDITEAGRNKVLGYFEI